MRILCVVIAVITKNISEIIVCVPAFLNFLNGNVAFLRFIIVVIAIFLDIFTVFGCRRVLLFVEIIVLLFFVVEIVFIILCHSLGRIFCARHFLCIRGR